MYVRVEHKNIKIILPKLILQALHNLICHTLFLKLERGVKVLRKTVCHCCNEFTSRNFSLCFSYFGNSVRLLNSKEELQ